ncbi:EAL domain-containing protein [Terriglobus albidus]|uniref:cyclic-guanylate-specific phosphodiesterase n=1 Tax=Terriglobus albidus TaxID=1592106 RepID=A0A5B9E4D5_9BACT|nr:EAL domain-containing protein [Terriglobus albidus]QEE26828.1 EAL domain-containing protein [Terriglobus albidus]
MKPASNTRKIALAIVLCSVALLLPIWASLQLSWIQSELNERNDGFEYVHDILRRAEETADQVSHAVERINSSHLPPCSEQERDLMRDIDLESDYTQAIGRIANNIIICSSLDNNEPIYLGKPDLVTENGVGEYFHVLLTRNKQHPLNVFAKDGVAVITDPDLPLDVSLNDNDISLALLVPSANGQQVLASRGNRIDPHWVRSLPKGEERTYNKDGYMVMAARSSRYDLAVLVASPQERIDRRVRHFALLFVPIGVLCGVSLIWATMYLARLRSSFDNRLKAAVRRREFYVEYQPVVDLKSRRWTGAEALVRWRTDNTTVRPDHFIPLAEERHLIHLITEQVISLIAEDLPRILKIDPAFRVAINLSPDDLRTQSTVEMLRSLLALEGVCPGNLEVEATERAFVEDQKISRVLEQIRSLGIQVAIDDFGIGYSSLSRIHSFRFDILKIDKTFVDTIGTEGAARGVMLPIIDIARSLDLHIVAEGVEREEQARFLQAYGIERAQGWLFSAPLSAAALSKELRERSHEAVECKE